LLGLFFFQPVQLIDRKLGQRDRARSIGFRCLEANPGLRLFEASRLKSPEKGCGKSTLVT
jgi:hypothetical protein